jgi:D-glycero-D-manno-heptose 1,7-bisphosphate phosphatase
VSGRSRGSLAVRESKTNAPDSQNGEVCPTTIEQMQHRRSVAIFLDRDGVLNELVGDPHSAVQESPLRVEEVRLVTGAAAALARLQEAGYVLVCVSNQPAAAKGTVSLRQLAAVHARVIELLAAEGVRLTASRLCLHHPDGVVFGLSGPCLCRKPAPGMLLEVAATLQVDLAGSWMVGDTDADVGAGRAAGCRTLMVEHPGSAHKRSGPASADLRAARLFDGVRAILGEGDSRWTGGSGRQLCGPGVSRSPQKGGNSASSS